MIDKRILQLRENLINNLHQQWTVKGMAKICEISMPHLQKLFKANTGMSPIMYLRNLRLEKARELLVTTFKQIKEIRLEVGMINESHFTRDFKKKYGVTPTVYRKLSWAEIPTENSKKEK